MPAPPASPVLALAAAAAPRSGPCSARSSCASLRSPAVRSSSGGARIWSGRATSTPASSSRAARVRPLRGCSGDLALDSA